jgi:hypothetical protein
MDRRAFIDVLASGLATFSLFAAPIISRAQPTRTARIGWLVIDPLPEQRAALTQGLREFGYVEGRITEHLHRGQYALHQVSINRG